jgi:hypothetical protein
VAHIRILYKFLAELLALKLKQQEMKRFNFLPVVVAFVLMITAVGCTTMTGAEDGYSRSRADRVYVDDPYRGTVVLERDPYTGRYYEVNPYGSYNTRTYRGSNGYYGRTNNSRYYNRNYRTNREVYERGNQNTQRPTDDQIKDRQKSRDEARRKVLGN